MVGTDLETKVGGFEAQPAIVMRLKLQREGSSQAV